MRALRRFAVLLLIVAAIGCAGMHAESASQLPMPTSYVQDFAGVIDAGSKQQMEQLGREVWLQAHAKIIVVTEYEGDDMRAAALEAGALECVQKCEISSLPDVISSVTDAV